MGKADLKGFAVSTTSADQCRACRHLVRHAQEAGLAVNAPEVVASAQDAGGRLGARSPSRRPAPGVARR